MNAKIFLILFGLVFFTFNQAEAKGIPYCSKKVVRGCVQPKPGQISKVYYAPKYKVSHASTHVKSKVAKSSSKKIAKNSSNKKVTKPKRGTASSFDLKLKKTKKKKSKI